jgi:hypothetical protein
MSRLPVFEDTTWSSARHRGKLQWYTDVTWAGCDYRIVLTLGTKKVYVDLFSGRARRMTMIADMFCTRLIDLQRFAFDSVVYYLSQATPLVDAIQDPLPYWQH